MTSKPKKRQGIYLLSINKEVLKINKKGPKTNRIKDNRYREKDAKIIKNVFSKDTQPHKL